MRKLYYKLLLFMVVGALAAPFVLRDGDGHPLMSLGRLKMPELATPRLPEVGGLVREVKQRLPIGDADEPHSATVYRWRDAAGVWHYSNDPNAAEAGGERMELDLQANVVPAERPATAGQVQAAETGPAATATSSASPLAPLTRGPQLIEQAQQVDQVLQDRKAAQDRIIDEL